MIAEYLRNECRGRENAASAFKLCGVFRISDRELRDVVRREREAGNPIISLDSGYFWPTGPDDEGAWHCIGKLRAHARAELAAAYDIEEGLESLGRQGEQLLLEV